MKTLAIRSGAFLFSVAMAVSILGTPPVTAAAEAPFPGDALRAELNGESIAKAPGEDLVKAVRKATARDPKLGASILKEALMMPRPDTVELAAPLVAAAIEGLGPKATPAAIAYLVRVAVQRAPAAALRIVAAAVRVSPNDAAPLIVGAAVAALHSPTSSVAQQIVQAAEGAKPGELNVALLEKAAANALALRSSAPATDGKEVVDAKGLPPIGELADVSSPGFTGLGVPIEEFPQLLAQVQPPATPATPVLAPTVPIASP